MFGVLKQTPTRIMRVQCRSETIILESVDIIIKLYGKLIS